MKARTIPITLSDGKPRNLYYGFNALIKITKVVGINIFEIGTAMSGPGSLEAIRGILWAGLVHEDEKLTLEATGNLLDGEFYRMPQISELIVEAVTSAYGPPIDGDPKNAETPEATTPATSL